MKKNQLTVTMSVPTFTHKDNMELSKYKKGTHFLNTTLKTSCFILP